MPCALPRYRVRTDRRRLQHDEARWLGAPRIHVGNLYFNRKCTGAFVGVHPFGGFNMSGTDSKAGARLPVAVLASETVVSKDRRDRQQ